MFNERDQIIVLFLSAIGIFLQTLYVRSPFDKKGELGQLASSLNVALYYAFLTGGIVITSNIFVSPLWMMLKTVTSNTILFNMFQIGILNIIYLAVKTVYPKIVKRKDEEDFLTRFMTEGQRRNDPYDFSRPEDAKKADYTIRFIIRPFLTAVIHLVSCIVLGVTFVFLRYFVLGKGLFN
jgi:hypothetical protein